MKEKIIILFRFIILILFISTSSIKAQVLNDTASLDIIKKGIDYIYNFQFDKADNVYRFINQKYPGHPMSYLLRGIITYWKNYPLMPSSPAHISCENDLHTCIDLSSKEHSPSDEAEFLLMDLCARGLLLDYYANNDLNMEVIPLAKDTYKNIRRAFDFTSIYTDFYFFTGLYNYYREAYPEAHRLYKSFAFLFPKGNKANGYHEIQIAAKKSIFLKAEASSLLSWINISFENSYLKAFEYSKSLSELYPKNPEYLGDYIKNLLLIKKYNDAETLIIKSGNINNSYYKAQLSIFNGILQEKKYHNSEKAEQYYNEGINDISNFGPYGNEFAAYAYFGLSRISKDNSDKYNKRTYRKKAFDLAIYKKVNFDN